MAVPDITNPAHKRRSVVAPFIAVAAAIVLLVGTLTWLVVGQSDLGGRVTRIETSNPCELHEQARCQRAIEFFIRSMTPAERSDLAMSVAPFLTSSTNGSVTARGSTGPQGVRGLQGLPGVVGKRGERGKQGSTGVRGQAGPQGSVGPQGAAGTRGPQGSRGERGPRGARGPRGPRGERGLPGPEGPIPPLSAVCRALHLPCG